MGISEESTEQGQIRSSDLLSGTHDIRFRVERLPLREPPEAVRTSQKVFFGDFHAYGS